MMSRPRPAPDLDPLAADEEAELWLRVRTGSAEAREAMFDRHAGFARQIAARQYRDRTRGDLELFELRQLAYAGLLEAIDRFDPDRGVPFRGYASRRITGSVLDGIAQASEVREQVAFKGRLRAERVRSLAPEDVDAMGASDAMQALAELAAGLAIGFLLDGGLTAGEEAADPAPSAYESLAWRETVQGLRAAMDDLPEKEQLIIRQHYLHGVAFELIARLLGLSKGRVSQLHKAAIERLRKRLGSRPEFVLQR
jgi:RNA polymerase sigma factor for flagellar operon FliA